MKLIQYVCLLAGFLATNAVTAAEPVFGSVTESQNARILAPPKGKALIYIYQLAEDGGGVSPEIRLNNYNIGRLVPGSFTVWKLSPGRLELSFANQTGRMRLTSQASKIYLFRLSVRQTASGSKAQLTGLPGSYRTELAGARLLKNPRALTAMASLPPKTPAATSAQAQPEESAQLKQTETPQQQTAAESEQPAEQPRKRSHTHIRSGGYSLLLKTGAVTLSEGTQTIFSVSRNFDTKATGIYSLEFDYQLPNGVVLGGELLGYKTAFHSAGLTNNYPVDVRILFANAKNYFRSGSPLQPYVGVGLGYAVAETSTDSGTLISGTTSSYAYQLIAGIEYRTESVGVFAEAKYIAADTQDAAGESVNVSGTGFFGGVAFHF